MALSWTQLLPQVGEGWWMAVVGAIMLAAAEAARIPLAMALRSHRSVAMGLLAVLGLAAMVLVTTKTVSQVLAQAYHPRLVAVQEATAELKLAEADLVVIASKRGSVDKGREAAAGARRAGQMPRIAELNKLIGEQGEAPKPRAEKKSAAPPLSRAGSIQMVPAKSRPPSFATTPSQTVTGPRSERTSATTASPCRTAHASPAGLAKCAWWRKGAA